MITLTNDEIMTLYQLFKEKFGLRFNDYLDVQMSAISGKPTIDPFKFDDWLHEKYGNYEEDGYSMETLLIKQYGQGVADQIRIGIGQ